MVLPAPTPAPVRSVVDWHNRHPLALRITAAQVHSPGWVTLPVVLRQGAAQPAAEPGAADTGASGAAAQTLRERAMARAHGAPQAPAPGVAKPTPAAPTDLADAEPAFSEDLLPPHRARELVRFACRQGSSSSLSAAAQPRREAAIDPRLVPQGRSIAWLHLQSAAIEAGDRRTRVLIGSGAPVALLGRRLFSRVRVAAMLSAVLVPLVAAAIWLSAVVMFGEGADRSAPAASAPAVAADDSTSMTARVPVPLPPADLAASASPSVAQPASTPAAYFGPAAPTLPAVPGVVPPASQSDGSIRPRLDPEQAKAVRRESAALRAASAAAAGASVASSAMRAAIQPRQPRALSDRPPPASAPASASVATAPAVGATGSAFALVARTTKSRAASAVLLGAMAGETGRNGAPPRAEVLATDGGYRASLWPFNAREQAQRVQQRLRESGLQTELVPF